MTHTAFIATETLSNKVLPGPRKKRKRRALIKKPDDIKYNTTEQIAKRLLIGAYIIY